MNAVKLRDGVSVKKKSNINILIEDEKLKKYPKAHGSTFSGLYDFFMEKNVFPKLFESDYKRHYEIIKENISEVKHNYVLEIAPGSCLTADYLDSTNFYCGVDISKRLLKKANKRLKNEGFKNYELFLSSADDLPFAEESFDFEMCHLSLNFFENLEKVIHEISRTLKKGGRFFCSIPVPERRSYEKASRKRIRGTLHSEKQLKELFSNEGLKFSSLPYENGSLFYFIAGK
ncbi:MAG: class I SAM-dependent methyltransferase [Thermotogota bacterium]|nr:class I SAM-dependent methyltransferase [Thermotogota bacterium]